ncbi:uncharacterized protein LOC124127833 [Haliotis rufescens]|uniref:uncharacterized protein LOC124127833 n=1 Tax=Haliotis rufescens TaxID=6454 RepID=UPI00201F441F|nr:uncharacterized protein LOC124127833 [Haliotis rufescens]
MPHWSEKGLRYQSGLMIQVAGFCVYVIGYGSPTWTQVYSLFQTDSVTAYHGLWQMCGKTISSCAVFESLNQEMHSWHQATRGLATISLIFSVISLLLLIRYNFTQFSRTAVDTRSVKALPTLAGITGIIASSIYAIRTQLLVSRNNASLSWGFALAVLGNAMMILSACLLCSRRGRPAAPPANRMQTWSTGMNLPPGGSAGFAYWEGSGGPMVNPAFQDASFIKPPDFADAPPSYEEAMRGSA